MKKVSFLVFAGCSILLSTCTKDIAGPDACFQEEILPVFVSNCAMSGCHNSTSKKEGYDFSNYEGIMKGINPKHPLTSEIYTTIKGKNPSMPPKPYGKLSSTHVNLIKLWINKGARNTSNCKSCDTINFGYSARIKPINETWCTGCHNAGNSSGGIDLSTYKGTIAAVAGNKLIGSIKHSTGFAAMPQGGPQLSLCEIAAIQKWINAGTPNN